MLFYFLNVHILGQESSYGLSTGLTTWKWYFSYYINIAFYIFIYGMSKLLAFPHCFHQIPQIDKIHCHTKLYDMHFGSQRIHIFGQECSHGLLTGLTIQNWDFSVCLNIAFFYCTKKLLQFSNPSRKIYCHAKL